MEVLKINDLHVSVDETPIIKGISITINKGEIHAIMGRNGAGKSTLANVVMGHPAYEITSGDIVFLGKPLDDYEVVFRGISLNGFPASNRVSLGMSKTRSDIMFFCISSVPPAIDEAGKEIKTSDTVPFSGLSSPLNIELAPEIIV